jgi:hypothetical protein
VKESYLLTAHKLCKNCKFYNPIYDAEKGECRKDSPVRLPRKFAGHATPGDRVRDEELIWGWPRVEPIEWCGKFKKGSR